ncbi:MAG: hypothetical protein HY294_14895 [Candidatus Rokubacteria bacterium]|nr:hypothetical protein [Candidatus Rokubacteria bacterium]
MRRTVSYRRINITLPERALKVVDRIAPRGDRSRFIAEAIDHYVVATRRRNLRKKLKEGAIRHAERDRRLAADWFALDAQAWERRRA